MVNGYKNLPYELAHLINDYDGPKTIPGMFETVSSNKDKIFMFNFQGEDDDSLVGPCVSLYNKERVIITISITAEAGAAVVSETLIIKVTKEDVCSILANE